MARTDTPSTRTSAGSRSAQNRPSRPGHEGPNPVADCARVCAETLDHCLTKGGKHAEASHIKGLIDCIEMCQLNASFHARKSESMQQVMALCAEVCRSCEESCSGFGDDPQMKACAEACRACAEHCESM